ncbi:hypothetical protein D049_1292B, partial [Vibrio parahaemolyticus VPTS-2010]
LHLRFLTANRIMLMSLVGCR